MKKYLYISVLLPLLLVSPSTQLWAQNQMYSLDECIDYAWEKSTDISRAKSSIESKKAYLDQSKAALYPNLFLNVNQNSSSSNNYQNDGLWNRDTYLGLNLSLSSSVTLYNGAKLLNTISQSKSNLAAAESDIQTQKEIISLNVLTAYINVLLAKEQLKNSEAQLNSTKKQLDYASVRKSAGIISKADYLNIKSQYATDKVTLIAAQSGLKINLLSLMQIMNMPVNDSFSIKEPDIQTLVNNSTNFDADRIYNIALGIRPEIKTAKYNWESARTGIKIARADGLPSLSLTGSIGSNYSNNLKGVDFAEQISNQITPAIGLSLSIPIYQRKKVKNQVTQATIQAENYEYNLVDIKNNLRKAIEEACIDAYTAKMNYKASQEQYEAEQESYRLSDEMFAQGLINSVDYLTSKNNLAAAENNLTRSKYNVALQAKIVDYYLGKPITL